MSDEQKRRREEIVAIVGNLIRWVRRMDGRDEGPSDAQRRWFDEQMRRVEELGATDAEPS